MSDISYDLIKKSLDVSSLRQKTISSNIANINTRGYKVNKVEFEKYLSSATEKIAIKKTHPKHFGIDSIKNVEPTVSKRTSTSLNDNGNNVDIDLEMTELAANEIFYNVLVQQMNARLGNLNYVINK